MSYDIYGNNLKEGYCEVHPNVPEYYPCYICCKEIERENERHLAQRKQPGLEHPEPKIYEIDFNGYLLAKIEVYGNELKVLDAINGYGIQIKSTIK